MGSFVMLVGNEIKVILGSVLGAASYTFDLCTCEVEAKIGRSQGAPQASQGYVGETLSSKQNNSKENQDKQTRSTTPLHLNSRTEIHKRIKLKANYNLGSGLLHLILRTCSV